MANEYIPIYQPSLLGNEKKYVNDCLDSNWISSKGSYIEKFENEFSQKVGAKHSATVSNGTVALHLALLATGISHEDEVIVPTLTYIASVNCIRYVGAKVVFADSIASTWQLDPKSIESKITIKTKAIMVVHLYGGACDMTAILRIAKKYHLYVIEDCAEALGTLYKNKHVGAFGHIACFSFYGNKTITTGEGGMVVTNDQTLFDRVAHFRGQGLAAYRQYWHDVIGYNYRMTNICAAIGLAQLESAEAFISRKKEIAEYYIGKLKEYPVEFQSVGKNVSHSYWMVSVLAKDADQRNSLRKYLDGKSIETRPIFYPVHTMPMYSSRFEGFPVAEDIGWRGLNLPSWPGLTEEQLLYITNCIRDYF